MSTRRRTRLLPAMLAGLGLVVALVGAVGQAGAVPVNQSRAVPPTATITISGKGFGHGIGLSQYGARGAARAGLNADQIAAFYYPGTTRGTAGGHISVRITADNDGHTTVAHQTGLQVIEVASGKRFNMWPNRTTQWRLSYGGGDTTLLSSLENGRWIYAGRFKGDAEFYGGSGGPPVTLILPNGQRKQYRGSLRATIPSPGAAPRETVNLLQLDHYLLGVVPLEMPSSWEPAAVQAQAIAARSYAARQRLTPKARNYQICDTTSCQVYGGYSAEQAASTRAVQATASRVLMHGGQPAFTQFSSSSGGWTAQGSQPYLVAKEDPYDKPSGNPNHLWSVQVTDTTIERAWPQIGDLNALFITDRTGNGDWQGRVNTITFRGSRGSVTLTGNQVRSALGLKSNWFAMSVAPR